MFEKFYNSWVNMLLLVMADSIIASILFFIGNQLTMSLFAGYTIVVGFRAMFLTYSFQQEGMIRNLIKSFKPLLLKGGLLSVVYIVIDYLLFLNFNLLEGMGVPFIVFPIVGFFALELVMIQIYSLLILGLNPTIGVKDLIRYGFYISNKKFPKIILIGLNILIGYLLMNILPILYFFIPGLVMYMITQITYNDIAYLQ